MNKPNLCTRFREGLSCLGVVARDGIREFLERYRKTFPGSARPGPPVHFPAADWRHEVLNDFASWLKEIDEAEYNPPALTLSGDFHQALTELAAFRQEVKRQSREQSKMSEEMARLGGLYREALDSLVLKADNLAALQQDVRHETEKSVFLLFADMRDALQRGADEMRTAVQQQSLFRRLPPAWQAVREGYEIALNRFDRAMAQLGIRRVVAAGEPFDPRCMVAIATRRLPEVNAGTVVEEAMSGYLRGDEVLRAAQVVVAAEDGEAQ